MTITFVDQKNRQKYALITQYASAKEMCPVRAWATIVARICLYLNTGTYMDVDVFSTGDRTLEHVQAIDASRHLKTIVTIIRKAKLGFGASRVGTH